jgi:hypothetical protein
VVDMVSMRHRRDYYNRFGGDMLRSYSTIFNVGHRAVQPLLNELCLVEEKVDGSQFSFGRINGEVVMRSKGAVVHAGGGGMFEDASHIESDINSMPDGLIFRCEYLQKPRHNVIAYNRVPDKFLIVFDVEDGNEGFLDYPAKREAAAAIGLEVVPRLYEGLVTLEILQGLLDRESVLGGAKIEGVVVKPLQYNLYGVDKKVLMGKYVSEAFKEKHQREWKAENKPQVVDLLVAELRTEARWLKAIQHLAEMEMLDNSPRDIGPLIKEVLKDIEREEIDYVKEKLFQRFWPDIKRQLTWGLPEWYKERLLKEAFDATNSASMAPNNNV